VAAARSRELAAEACYYWERRLSGCGYLRFPDDKNMTTGGRPGFGIESVRIGAGLKTELRDWCRLHRTTLPMGVFTAYVGLRFAFGAKGERESFCIRRMVDSA